MKKGKLRVVEQDGKLVLLVDYTNSRHKQTSREVVNAVNVSHELDGCVCEYEFNTTGDAFAVLKCDERSLLMQSLSQSDIHDKLHSSLTSNYALKINKGGKETNPGQFKYYFEKRHINKCDFPFDSGQITQLTARRERMFDSLNCPKELFTGSPDWRMVVGLGNPSVYETSMTLHHIYGFPYIPGSALKGIASHWAAREVIGDTTKEMKEAMKDDLFRLVFGNPKEHDYNAAKGFVVFHDAMPIEAPTIAPDVMTPHYQPYYGKKEPPGDYHDPNPITFCTVVKGRFSFVLTLHDRANFLRDHEKYTPDCVLGAAKKWLIAALKMGGVGAKSAVGYGYLNIEGETEPHASD